MSLRLDDENAENMKSKQAMTPSKRNSTEQPTDSATQSLSSASTDADDQAIERRANELASHYREVGWSYTITDLIYTAIKEGIVIGIARERARALQICDAHFGVVGAELVGRAIRNGDTP